MSIPKSFQNIVPNAKFATTKHITYPKETDSILSLILGVIMNAFAKTENVLEVKNLITAFSDGKKDIPIIDDISFHVSKGKTLGLVGESGCGKSMTGLSLLQLIPKPPCYFKGGNIFFNNQDLLKFTEKQMQKIRGAKISMIFQDPMTSLNPVLTIGDQISEVFLTHNKVTKKEAQELSISMLEKVKISDCKKRFYEYPHQLSGGMRQRIMIAMSLACKPELLIADEPTTALDVTIQAQILSLMNQLQSERQMAMIFITHDLGVVAQICDEVAVMYAGKIVEISSAKDLFADPWHPYTLGLLESIPKMGQNLKRLKTIPGIVPKYQNLPKGCRFQERCPFVFDKCREVEPELLPAKSHTDSERKVACFLKQ